MILNNMQPTYRPSILEKLNQRESGEIENTSWKVRAYGIYARVVDCLVPRRLSFDENVRAKEGGKETTGETSGRSCFQDGGKSNGGRICSF